MSKADGNTYDAIIIGAGIGGLVCGAYLAKAGMKVLIVEQHYRPGGYCASFRRGDFVFDAAPHCFGSYRQGGQMRKVLSGLGLSDKLKIRRPDPCDTIVTPDYRISFWNDPGKTIHELEASFPHESPNINRFFKLLTESKLVSFLRLRNLTLRDLLDQYFANGDLKALLSLPLLAIGGLPPSMMSACVGAQFYSEFLLDGGYIPEGGMQELSNAIADRFKEYGGELLLSRRATKIDSKDGKVSGATIEHEGFIPARFVVSNCDARQTFLALLGSDRLEKEFCATLKGMQPSTSSFIIYLGMDRTFESSLTPGTVYLHFDHHDAEKAFQTVNSRELGDGSWYAVRTSLDRTTVYIEMLTPFQSADYWKRNKEKILETFIAKLERETMPNLSHHILFRDAATPHTLFRYTSNYRGASYGWAGIPSQTIVPGFRKPPFVQNLYLAGHWTTLAVGISGVAYVGFDTATMIMKRRKSFSLSAPVQM